MKTARGRAGLFVTVFVGGAFWALPLLGQVDGKGPSSPDEKLALEMRNKSKEGQAISAEAIRSPLWNLQDRRRETFDGTTGPSSYATGFEPGEGLMPGYIGGQAGWTAFAASTAEGHIDTVNPQAGTQHLRISHDAAAGLNFTGAFSPNLGLPPNSVSTTSIDIAIGATGGADYYIIAQAPSEGSKTWEVRFSYLSTIRILDDLGFGWVYVDTEALWGPGPYVRLTVCDDPVSGTTDYYYGGALIYSQVTHLAGSRVQQLVLVSDNWHAAESGDFDNLSVEDVLVGLCSLTSTCGNDIVEPGEECDGTDSAACPGLCIDPGEPDECTCPPPVCGNNIVEEGEECDGTADDACPGECLPPGDPDECTCPCHDYEQILDCQQVYHLTGDTAGENSDCDFLAGPEHIWKIEITEAGLYNFDTCGGPDQGLDCYVMLYDECCGGNAITADDDGCPGTALSLLECVDLAVGTYYLHVENWSWSEGPYDVMVDCCPVAVCGNNIREFPEQCDGTDDAACPGLCIGPGEPNECTCTPPPNDECDGATNVTVVPYSELSVNMPTASDDAYADPSCDSSGNTSGGNNGVWYTYTPGKDCEATISRWGVGGYLDTLVSVWTGADCNDLTQVDCIDLETATLDLTGDTPYWLLVSYYFSSEPPYAFDFLFDCAEPPAPPENDQCPGTWVDCGSTLTGQTTVAGTNDYDEGGACTGFLQGGADVVYELALPYEAHVTVTVQNVVGFDPSFYVVTDCADPAACIAGADSGLTGDDETAIFIADAGTYYIIVDTYSSTGEGTFDLEVQCVQVADGACCGGSGVCTIETQGGCALAGGSYAGDHTDCVGSGAGGGTDCDSNGYIDFCEIVDGAPDCQPNGLPDECDIPPIGSVPDCQGDGIPDECQLSGPGTRTVVISEGFENTFPPDGWENIAYDSNGPWQVSTNLDYVHSGHQSAVHAWSSFDYSDSYLLTPELGFASGTVSVWSMGCYAQPWCDSYDIDVMIVIGAPGGGDDIFVGNLNDLWTDAFETWVEAMYDLSPLLPGGPFRIGFRYYGFDGDLGVIDDVVVWGGSPPNDCNSNAIPDECDPPTCGNDCLEGGAAGYEAEECDGAEEAACPGECYSPGHAYECQCPFCGDGVIGPDEECDGGGCCTTECTLAAAGTVCRASTGLCDPVESCGGTSAVCPDDVTITGCIHADGCCPLGCNHNTDNDCPPLCGNNIVEGDEACDGTDDQWCPRSCDPDCTCPLWDIPTVSQWSLVVLALLTLAGAKIYFGRRPAQIAGE